MEATRFIFDIIESTALTIAAITATITAIIGLSTWRKQLVGRRQIELAEEALTLAYELQGIIEWARYPGSFRNEAEDRPGRDEETDVVRSSNDAYYVSISRFSQHEETFAKMRALRMRFRAYFGDRGQDALMEFALVRNRIGSSVRMLISKDLDRVRSDLVREWEETIWEGYADGDDKIKLRVDNAVGKIEDLCRPILTRE